MSWCGFGVDQYADKGLDAAFQKQSSAFFKQIPKKGKNENTAGTNMSNPKTYMRTPCRNEANIKQSPGLASGQSRVKMNKQQGTSREQRAQTNSYTAGCERKTKDR
ncbi:hypothetical protein GOODEAATRI_031203 [Goodea atripinnis]|uniref:Uncharacterized protein n=1 Tax=Goodea atripinnis TaxID=208336 RepID=A0ABV0Q3G9_9TELE